MPATSSQWIICPFCAGSLTNKIIEGFTKQACTKCGTVRWDNPIPVVATFIPLTKGVVLIQRGVEPFVGRWCLPRGYINTGEIPKRAAVREALEETGLKVRLVRLLNACNPSPPGMQLNQITMFYLATLAQDTGPLCAGSDALDVSIFAPNKLPDICFPSDRKLIDDWYAGKQGTISQPMNYQ